MSPLREALTAMDYEQIERDSSWLHDLPPGGQPTLSAVLSGEVSGVVSAQAAAALLGVNERTIRRAIQRGELPASKIGKSFAITPEALSAYRRRQLPKAPVGTAPILEVLPYEPSPATPLTLLPPPERQHAPVPSPLTPFVGRTREISRLSELVQRGDPRLLTLTGPGGVGKSRLAIQVAKQVADHFSDGAAFVGLAAVPTADGVMSTIARALGQREDGERSAFERVEAYYRTRHALLVLDNVEQVTDAGPEFMELLTACPRLSLLVTSRSPLHLTGEVLFETLPLSLPDGMD